MSVRGRLGRLRTKHTLHGCLEHDVDCFKKAKKRGQQTFTLVAQDKSSPRSICFWIMENIETCTNPDKLRCALEDAIAMRNYPERKHAD